MLFNTFTLAISVLFASKAIALPLPVPAGNAGPCSSEGKFNCISDTLFQQCGSGQWSVTMSLAEGGAKCWEIFGTSQSPSPPPPAQDKPTTSTPVQAKPEAKAEVKAPTSVEAPQKAPSSNSFVQKEQQAPSPSPSPSAEVKQDNPSGPIGAPIGSAKSYSGPATSFPSPSSWLSYDKLWALNKPALEVNDHKEEVTAIQGAIEKVATSSGIDRRVILAVVMQESAGNVRVPTTNNGVRNPGIMQSHDGAEYSDMGSIEQMIRDGVEGTKSGDGLKQAMDKQKNIFEAVRLYNSGSVNTGELSNGLGSTASYVSDIANRLMGTKTSCPEGCDKVPHTV